MKVFQLKEIISKFDDDEEVVIVSGSYAYNIDVGLGRLSKFDEDDEDVCVIKELSQIGTGELF